MRDLSPERGARLSRFFALLIATGSGETGMCKLSLDRCQAATYIVCMIRSFKNKGLRKFAEKGDASKLSVRNEGKVRRILAALDVATAPEQMDIPGYRFHPLQGDNMGRFSVTVTGNWRITFAFDGEDAVDVDLEDYH